jgi:hypothetical protein
MYLSGDGALTRTLAILYLGERLLPLVFRKEECTFKFLYRLYHQIFNAGC